MRQPNHLGVLAAMAGLIGGYDHTDPNYSRPRRNRMCGFGTGYGSCRKARNTDNRPDRAPGMKAFQIGEQTIYAGTLKAAHKKARLLSIVTTP